MLQFQDANLNQIYQEGSIFTTSEKLPDFKNVALKTSVKLSSINNLNISYTDLVGNIYNSGSVFADYMHVTKSIATSVNRKFKDKNPQI